MSMKFFLLVSTSGNEYMYTCICIYLNIY